VKLLLVDKRELFREGLARVLGDQPNMEVVGTCGSADEAIEKAKELQPDVVLIDTELEQNGCIEAVAHVSKLLPNTRVLILTHSEDKNDIFANFLAGAHGYASKDISVECIVRAINIVFKGGVIISPPLAARMVEQFTSMPSGKEAKTDGRDIHLSKRECEVLSMVSKGASNREIANTLFMSESTAKTHVRNIMEKLHMGSRLKAAILAQEKGIIPPVSEGAEDWID